MKLLLIALLVSVSGCATYNACNDPKSAIVFMPEQCHASFNRDKIVVKYGWIQ